jgi:hypothetical protein
VGPVGASENGAGNTDKQDEEDNPAAATTAATAAKAKPALRPVKDGIDKEEFEQARETSGTVIHFFSFVTIEFNMKYANRTNKWHARRALKWA